MVYLVISNHLTTFFLIILQTKSIILALSIFTVVALPTTLFGELFLYVLMFISMLWFYFHQKSKSQQHEYIYEKTQKGVFSSKKGCEIVWPEHQL
ncbi:hypothetical protein EUGRSUZ_C01755 [Eucalyptus grandis]|uniref:Uncharacterized protein n=2 Tax=Eucalyptus grandis TaxID=71139 RepID=A0ACC3LEU0_EUCGR|nr:hypothetical protein EUGRSUZ_C01755 [Eucalyptus grandis]